MSVAGGGEYAERELRRCDPRHRTHCMLRRVLCVACWGPMRSLVGVGYRNGERNGNRQRSRRLLVVPIARVGS